MDGKPAKITRCRYVEQSRGGELPHSFIMKIALVDTDTNIVPPPLPEEEENTINVNIRSIDTGSDTDFDIDLPSLDFLFNMNK